MNPTAAAATAAVLPADDDEIIYENPMLIRAYRSGRVERLVPANFILASLDPTTGVNSKDCIINSSTGVSARLYLPPSNNTGKKLPILIYYHGGGFCVMSAFYKEYHNFLSALTAGANILAVSVDYRLAPENPLPAAYDDAWDAIRWVFSSTEDWLTKFGNTEKIFLAGDSAGGNIAHNTAMRLGSEGVKVEGLALIHPYFWGEERIGVEGEVREKVMLSAKDAEGLWRVACDRKFGFDDPRLNPCADNAVGMRGLGCGRVLVCVAERDILRDRGRVYYEKLRDGGGWKGSAELVDVEGEDHVFFLFNPESERAVAFVDSLVNFFKKD